MKPKDFESMENFAGLGYLFERHRSGFSELQRNHFHSTRGLQASMVY